MGIRNLPQGRTVGFFGTNGSFGLAGDEARMPGDLEVHFPFGHSRNDAMEIQLDSREDGVGGVLPTDHVPMTPENALRMAQGEDVELEYAVRLMEELISEKK